jgi:hypothetical protein
LKENVIIGKLIPSGTGFSASRIDEIAIMTGEQEAPVAEETSEIAETIEPALDAE